MNQVIKLLKNHRSIRKFKLEPVSDEKVYAIIEAAGWAATSNFIQAYSVIRVTNKETRKQIAELAGPQPWVEKCPLFLVFCADLKRAQNACIYEDKEMLSGYTEQFIVATVDVALAAQNAMIAAESLDLGGVISAVFEMIRKKSASFLRFQSMYTRYSVCAWDIRMENMSRNQDYPFMWF